jgi:protein phosphatase
MLCSDGLHGVIDERSLAEVLSSGGDLAGRASALVEMARERGGPDNITVVLVENHP